MNINQLMKQAQQLQKKAAKKQAELDALVHDFEGGNQLIKGQIKGNLEIVSLEIDPSLCAVEEKENLEDLLTVTLNKKIKEITDHNEKVMATLTSGAKGLF